MFTITVVNVCTCYMLRLHRPRLHHEGLSSLEGQDRVGHHAALRLALPVAVTAGVIGQLDDLLEVSRLTVGGQAVVVFGVLDTVYHRSRVPGHGAERRHGTETGLTSVCFVSAL